MSNWDFALAIDIGNSRVVSAIARVTRGVEKEATVFACGDDEHSAVSAVFVDHSGELSFGSEAERRGAEHPERLVREFAHHLGDGVPLVIGEHAVRAEDLYARMCAWIVEAAIRSEGAPPSVIAITHPTSWAGHRRSLITAALERVGITEAILLSEAESVARHYEASHPLETGQFVAVYDLGGTHFDALVVRKRAAKGAGCQPIGEQVTLDTVGGVAFDEYLLRHVLATTDAAGTDTAERADVVSHLRLELVKAKEALSSEADATVPMACVADSATVRINRSEFESLIDEPLDKTLDALDLAIESVGIQPSRLEAILLTGGSSRIPLIAQRLSERFDLPLVADNDPKAAVALGAARIALDRLEEGLSPDTALVAVEDASAAGSDLVPTGASSGKLRVLRPESGRSWWPKSPILLTTAAAFIAFAIVFSNTTAAGARWPDYFAPIADRAAEIVAPLIPAGSTSPPPASALPSDSDAETSTRNASQERTLPRDSSTAEHHTTHTNAARDPHDSAVTPPRKHRAGPKVEPSGPPADETAADSTPSNSANTPVASAPPDKTDSPVPTEPTDGTSPADNGAPTEASDPSPSEPAPSGSTTPPSTTPPTDPPPSTEPAPTTPPAESTPPADQTPTPADPPAAAPEPAPTPAPSGGPTPEPTT